MALWQYTFIIIPKKVTSKIDSLTKIDEKIYNETAFWNIEYAGSFFKEFHKILPIAESWSKDIILFGKEDSNRLEIILENKKIVEVILRLDFRADYTALLNKILKFCTSNKLILLDENLNVMADDVSRIVKVIEDSQQFNLYKEMS